MKKGRSGYFRSDKMTPRQREQAIKLVAGGMSMIAVAAKYGVTRQYIYRLCKR